MVGTDSLQFASIVFLRPLDSAVDPASEHGGMPYRSADSAESLRGRLLPDVSCSVAAEPYKRQPRKPVPIPWYIVRPKGIVRRVWDSIALVLIEFTVVMIPIWCAFYEQVRSCNFLVETSSPDGNGVVEGDEAHDMPLAWQAIWLATNWFFVIDMALNCFTAYEIGNSGALETRVPHIALRYVRSWFWIDLAANIPYDCIINACSDRMQTYNLGRCGRLIRLIGLRRRFHFSLTTLVDWISERCDEYTYAAKEVVKFSATALTLIHYCACAQWLVLRSLHFPNASWAAQLAVDHATVGQQYVWSVFNVVSAMIGLGYGAFPPSTWQEALLWIFVMLAVAITFAILNAMIFAYLMMARAPKQRFNARMQSLLSYIQDVGKDIPPRLKKQLIVAMKERYPGGKCFDGVLPVLYELDDHLVAEVGMSLVGSMLRRIPILRNEEGLLRMIASRLLLESSGEGAVLLPQHMAVKCMYFVKSGEVHLRIEGSAAAIVRRRGSWFGELAILVAMLDCDWCRNWGAETWKCLAHVPRTNQCTAIAASPCELYRLDLHELADVLRYYPRTQHALLQHACDYVMNMLFQEQMQQQPTQPPKAAAGDREQATAARAAALRRHSMPALPAFHEILPTLPEQSRDSTDGTNNHHGGSDGTGLEISRVDDSVRTTRSRLGTQSLPHIPEQHPTQL